MRGRAVSTNHVTQYPKLNLLVKLDLLKLNIQVVPISQPEENYHYAHLNRHYQGIQETRKFKDQEFIITKETWARIYTIDVLGFLPFMSSSSAQSHTYY